MEFSKKKKSLFKTETPTQENNFVKEGLKLSAETVSGNGAKKYSTSNDAFVDNFSMIANFKAPRDYAEVSKDMYKLWSINPKKCLQLAVYIRLITRETQIVLPNETITLDVQRGQGLKNEGIMRMLWLAMHHKPTFMANMPYFIAAGSWKDVFEMMSLDLQYHGWEGRKLDWNFMRKVILAGLANGHTSELVKKYLPTIRSMKECKTVDSQARTIIGQYLASCIYGKKKDKKADKETADSRAAQRRYRKLKQSGTAHTWQQLISQKKLLELDFNTIHGRALSLLVGSKFLKNQGLVEKYSKWISGRKVAKYTGFVFELFQPLGDSYRTNRLEEYREQTINAQFNGLVETGRQNLNQNSKLLVVRDISGSMTFEAVGTNMSSYAIGKAMALYFSALLDGPFKDAYATFSSTCKLCTWKGKTPIEKWANDTDGNFGNTNLLSVADMFVKLRSTMKISENEFPTGALLVSDGEFDVASSWGGSGASVTNFTAFRQRLLKGGFSKEYVDNFKLILWDLPNGYYGGGLRPKFEDFADAPNNFYISGYDPAAVAFILGTKPFKATPKNATELFNAAMDQELLNRLVVSERKVVNKTKKNTNFKKNKK
jgi:hypothetical protein